ncbi:sodium-independent sulfate anion transporter [Spodoptera frugiperda]|uniref:Sodium-independent sulfate anion transporter n=1 Tax=Spodoptera frugiperda TaxID=7108 RepID=A0A9R0CXR2_SPOFR|nr:sodium-independent sulfate anion transporter [Spodoptera frugiperda]
MEEEGLPVSWRGAGDKAGGWARLARRRVPLLRWLPAYDRVSALADLVAGVTLGLTLVPQSIAYASLANLPVQYGLYSSFVGTMLYVVLGTVKEVSIGPTSLMALFTLQICRGLPVEFVVLLTFLSGCVVLIMGLLRLGFLVELISPSVTSGFTSATAIIIVAAQLKGLLGLSFTAESVGDNIRLIVTKWDDIRYADCALGAVCCTVLLLLRKLKDVRVRSPRVARALWLVSISRNALVVLAASSFAYLTHHPNQPLFKLSGRVEPGLPRLSVPPFSASVDNSTVTFVDMVQQLGSGVIMLPIVMVLANIAIAKAFCAGGRVDATQEMVTLGLCNMAGALVHAMPTCGAFTRSAVSHSSGVRTPAAGLYSGIITLLALIFLTQYFYFIPKACLSAVLICAVIFMVDVRSVGRLWRRDRRELAVLALTFCVSVLRTVELAVLAGAVASLAVLLRQLMRPDIHMHSIKTAHGEAVRVRPAQGLVYVNGELVARRLLAAAARAAPRPVLLDCAHLAMLDYAAMQVLERLIKKLKADEQLLIMYNVPEQLVARYELLEGVERRGLRATSAAEALASVAAASAPAQLPAGEESAALLAAAEPEPDALQP